MLSKKILISIPEGFYDWMCEKVKITKAKNGLMTFSSFVRFLMEEKYGSYRETKLREERSINVTKK